MNAISFTPAIESLKLFEQMKSRSQGIVQALNEPGLAKDMVLKAAAIIVPGGKSVTLAAKAAEHMNELLSMSRDDATLGFAQAREQHPSAGIVPTLKSAISLGQVAAQSRKNLNTQRASF